MARQLWITGFVQGVGYRAGFAAQARRLNLSGWVRNRVDGSVEALVAGSPEAVDEIILWARHGPALSKVDQVQIMEKSDAGIRSAAFEILPTE